MGYTEIGKGNGYCDTWELPKDGKAKKIIAQRVYSRFRDDKLSQFIADLKASLSDDGILYLYVLKHDELWETVNKNGELFRKLAFGPKWQSTSNWIRDIKDPKEVIELFYRNGFNFLGEFKEVDGMISPVPTWGLKFRKFMGYKAAHEYMQEFYTLPPDSLIAEVGPGNFPLPQATLFIEHPARKKNHRYSDEFINGKNVIFADIQTKIEEIPDKKIDFLWSSHILEHVLDPVAAAKEMSRIAKRGVIVVPSPYKDTFFLWDEPEHLWDIYRRNNGLLFVRRDDSQISKIRTQTMQNYFCDIFKGNQFTTNFEKEARYWFEANEKYMDIILPWEGSFEVNVV